MVPGVPADAIGMKRETAGTPVCSNCNSDDRWILHHVHHRKIFRLLCTSCVLKLHTTAFCPICFSLHHRLRKSSSPAPAPLPDLRGTLVCFKCNSASHANCVAPNTPKSPYLCPTCLSPNSKLFDLFKSNCPKAAAAAAAGRTQSIDLRSGKALRAAAMIAANSLNDAAEQAKAEAERKGKEAVIARKRAKDALDNVANAWSREIEKMRLREGAGEASPVPVVVSNQNGLLGFKPNNNSVAVKGERKESYNNGSLVEKKDVGSQHLQKNN